MALEKCKELGIDVAVTQTGNIILLDEDELKEFTDKYLNKMLKE